MRILLILTERDFIEVKARRLSFNQCSQMRGTMVIVSIIDDDELEDTEEFTIALDHEIAIPNVQLEQALATVRIIDDDSELEMLLNVYSYQC